MKLKYEAKKRLRIKDRFIWADICINGISDVPWVIEFPDGTKKWKKSSEIWNETGHMNTHIDGVKICGCASNFMPVRSIRAFRRRLREWSGTLPKGTEVTLVSRYIGHNVYGKIR